MIYERIVKLCSDRGISIAKLESECGFGNATVRGWSKSSPSVANLQKVARYFGVTLDELADDEDGGGQDDTG